MARSRRRRLKRAGRPWTPPKTSWGDPDLQGNYTNKYEYSRPFERPQEFEGRRLDDVSGKELADTVRKRLAEALARTAERSSESPVP